MSKKNIIGLVVTVIAIGLIGSLTMYLLSFHAVTFTFDKDDATIAVYQANDKEKKYKLGEVKKDAPTLRLQEGEYKAVVTNEIYDDKENNFTVTRSDSTVAIDIAFSARHLESLTESEFATINVKLREAFPRQIERFIIEKGKMYDEGQWYTTTLIQIPPHPSEQGDVYHVVVKKENNEWKVVGKPTLILTQSEFKEIPLSILKEGNRQNSL